MTQQQKIGSSSHNASNTPPAPIPLWLLAELTYACPLQCSYCSNPTNFQDSLKSELSTAQWINVLSQARHLGAVQLGLSGGEPLVRQDLEIIIAEARKLGFYSNLITSAIGMDRQRLGDLKDAGLDHIQISFQAASAELNDQLAGTQCFEHKIDMAIALKELGFPMVLNFVLHKQNIHQVKDMLTLAEELGADYVELANTQYYGWGLLNRSHLLPSKEQLIHAEKATNLFRQQTTGKMEIFFVVPDYYEDRPKACSNGWGTTFLTVTPDGTALPCQGAHSLPGVDFPNVKDETLKHIWQTSSLFNQYRGDQWMQEPCRSCPEKEIDFGGCRCQAFLLTGDPAATDPVCSLSPKHHVITDAIQKAKSFTQQARQNNDSARPLVIRNSKNAKQLTQTS